MINDYFIVYNEFVLNYFITKMKLCKNLNELDKVKKEVEQWFNLIMKWIFKDGEFPSYP